EAHARRRLRQGFGELGPQVVTEYPAGRKLLWCNVLQRQGHDPLAAAVPVGKVQGLTRSQGKVLARAVEAVAEVGSGVGQSPSEFGFRTEQAQPDRRSGIAQQLGSDQQSSPTAAD